MLLPLVSFIAWSGWTLLTEIAELVDEIRLVGPFTGIQLYFRDPWNCFELMALLYSLYMIQSCLDYWNVCVVCVNALHAAEERAEPGKGADFVDIKLLRDSQRDFQNNFAILVFMGYFKVFKYVAASAALSRLWIVLATAMKDVVAFMIVIFIILMSFAYFGVVLFGNHVQHFHNVPTALNALVRWSLGDYGYVDFDQMKSAASIMSTAYFVLFAFLVGLTSINLFVAIFVDWWEVRKQLKEEEDADVLRLKAEGLYDVEISCGRTCRYCCRRFKPEYGLQLYRDADDFELFDIVPKVQHLRQKCAEHRSRTPDQAGRRPPRLYVCFKREWKCVDDIRGSYCSGWVNGYSDKMFSPPVDPPPGCIEWKGAEDSSGQPHETSASTAPIYNREDLYLTLLDKNVEHNRLASDLFDNLGHFRNGNGADLVVGATDSSFASSCRLVKRRCGGTFIHTMVVKELGLDVQGQRFYRDRHYSIRDTFVEFELLDKDVKSLHQSSIFFRASKIGLVASADTKPWEKPPDQVAMDAEQRGGWKRKGHLNHADAERKLATQLRVAAIEANKGGCHEQCLMRYSVPKTAAFSQVAIQFQISAACMIWGEVWGQAFVTLPCRALASLRRKVVRLFCCGTKRQSKFLSKNGIDRFSLSIDSFLFARTREVNARHPKYDSSLQRLEFQENSLELLPARQFYHSLTLYLGTHGQGDELLAQVSCLFAERSV